MERKKSEQANLENKRGLFLEIGLVVVLGLIFLAFEWKSKPPKMEADNDQEVVEEDQEMVPITRQPETPPPPPPPPPKVIDVINIVDDDVEVSNINLNELFNNPDLELSNIDYTPEETEETVFIIVEDMPSFNGEGKEGFRSYIANNMSYPTIAQENGIEGRVYVQFTVNSKGQVVDVQVARGVDPSLDAEAVRVIKSSPPWEPGKQRGKPVSVRFTFPVNFVLQ